MYTPRYAQKTIKSDFLATLALWLVALMVCVGFAFTVKWYFNLPEQEIHNGRVVGKTKSGEKYIPYFTESSSNR